MTLSRLAPLLAVFLLAAAWIAPSGSAAQLELVDTATGASLRLGGRVQPRFEVRPGGGPAHTGGVSLKRARVDLSGRYRAGRLGFRIQPELAGRAELRDAWVDYLVLPSLGVQVGQFPVPFNYRIPSTRQQFAESGAATGAFGYPNLRDIGVLLHGGNPRGSLVYAVGAFNGAGLNARRIGSGLVSLRAAAAPRGTVLVDEVDFARGADNLAFGVGVQASRESEVRDWSLGRSAVGARGGDWLALTTDAQLQRRGLTLAAVGFHRFVSPADHALASYRGVGAEVSGGYVLVAERLDVGVRHARLRWDRAAPETRERHWLGVVNLYHRRHDLKTRFQYEWRDADGAGRRERVLIAEMQLAL